MTSCGGGIIYKYITTFVSVTLTQVHDIYVMYIHLPGRHYDAKLFHLKAFVSVFRTKPSKFVHILFFFWAVSRRYGAATSTSPTCLNLFRVKLRQVFSGLPARLFSVSRSFQEDLSAFLARVSGSAVSSEFKFLDAQNLTCLQPLPNTLYTNY